MSTTLRLYEQGSPESWRELVLTNIGKEKMDTIRSLSNDLLALETSKVAKDRESINQTLLLNRLGVTTMTALSLLALFMYLRQTAALDRQRGEQQNVVQAERDRLEVEVAARTAQLKELALHLQTVREDERSHLARELHDELGALLTAAKLDAARLKTRLGPTTPEVTERMAHLNEALNSGIALKRRIIEDLRPSSLSNLGLVAALEILVREYSARMELEVDCELHPVNLGPSAELTIYRLVQEALTNIAKYAKASRVQVKVGLARRQGRGLRARQRHRLRPSTPAPRHARAARHAVPRRIGERRDDDRIRTGLRHLDLRCAARSQANAGTGRDRRARSRGLNNDRANRPARLSASSYGPCQSLPTPQRRRDLSQRQCRGSTLVHRVEPDRAMRRNGSVGTLSIRTGQLQRTLPMNMPSSTTKPFGQTATNVGEQAASAADSAIRSTQRTADEAFDALSNKVDDLRSQAAPLINRVSAKAEDAAKRGLEAMRDSSQQLREKAQLASESTVAYVKDEPVKSMLIAAATGALLMGLVSLMGRSRD